MRSLDPKLGAMAALAWGLISLAGCATEYAYVWANDLKDQPDPTLIAAGDRIAVLVRNHEQASGEFAVRNDGTYVQPLVGAIEVAGLTPELASKRVATLLQGAIVDPRVLISVAVPRTLRVSVLGEVRQPGQFDVALGEGVLSAIARAGGLAEFASEDGIYVIRTQPTPMRIRFRYRELGGGDWRSATFRLENGDVVLVE